MSGLKEIIAMGALLLLAFIKQGANFVNAISEMSNGYELPNLRVRHGNSSPRKPA